MYLQYAFVPSGSVTSLGAKPRFSANAGYATSISTPMCLYQSLEPIASLAIWSDMGKVSLLMPNRRILQERPHHGYLDMIAVFRGPRFPPKQRREDGNQANAHCHSVSIHATVGFLRNDEPERRIARINVTLSSKDSWGLMTAMMHQRQHTKT